MRFETNSKKILSLQPYRFAETYKKVYRKMLMLIGEWRSMHATTNIIQCQVNSEPLFKNKTSYSKRAKFQAPVLGIKVYARGKQYIICQDHLKNQLNMRVSHVTSKSRNFKRDHTEYKCHSAQ